jgi:hypothetical protein
MFAQPGWHLLQYLRNLSSLQEFATGTYTPVFVLLLSAQTGSFLRPPRRIDTPCGTS